MTQAHPYAEQPVSTTRTARHKPASFVIKGRWPYLRRRLGLSSRFLDEQRCRGLGKERKRVLILVREIKGSPLQGALHERGRQALPFRGGGYGLCLVRGTGGSLQ